MSDVAELKCEKALLQRKVMWCVAVNNFCACQRHCPTRGRAILINKSSGWLFTFAGEQGDKFTFLGFSGKPAGYMIVFSYCAIAYLVGWSIMKTLVPHYKKVEA